MKSSAAHVQNGASGEGGSGQDRLGGSAGACCELWKSPAESPRVAPSPIPPAGPSRVERASLETLVSTSDKLSALGRNRAPSPHVYGA